MSVTIHFPHWLLWIGAGAIALIVLAFAALGAYLLLSGPWSSPRGGWGWW